MSNSISRIQQELFSMRDLNYRSFHSRLIPAISPDTIIGVRTPQLRRYAKQLSKTPDAQVFLHTLPHAYYEENNLHAFLIESHKDYAQVMDELNAFLPFVDNWATCDAMSPRILRSHTQELYPQVLTWIHSAHIYTIRYGIGTLLRHYLDEHFQPEHLAVVASIRSEDYYVNMMIAWYFSTALAKQYTAAIPYLTQHKLPQWVHNKTIQKAVESYRISPETKQYLRTLRWK